jgi:hypothetical protein
MTYPKKEELNRAGITDDEGYLERRVSQLSLHAPTDVRIEEGCLIWERVIKEGQGDTFVEPGPGLLSGFIRLADAPETDIRDYALRWGVFGICAHFEPCTHNEPGSSMLAHYCQPIVCSLVAEEVHRCYPLGHKLSLGGDSGWEPIKIWRRLSRRARAMLYIAANLHQGRPGEPEDWDVCTYLPREKRIALNPTTRTFDYRRQVSQEKDWLGSLVNNWLEVGGISVSFGWWRQGTYVSLDTGGGWLMGALAFQLMLAICRKDGFAFCRNCGNPFFPPRRLRANAHYYCEGENCGRKAMLRFATRAFRERKKIGAQSKRRKRKESAA